MWNAVLQTNYYFESSYQFSFSFTEYHTYQYGTPPSYSIIYYTPASAVLTVHKSGYVPPVDYWCYFDLEGVVFLDGQTNKGLSS